MANIKKMKTKRPSKAVGAGVPTLQEALEAAKAIGAAEIEYKGIRYVLRGVDPKPAINDLKTNITQPATEAKAEDLVAPEKVWDQYSDEEILFWSTEHYDELQWKKEQMIKKEQGDEV